MAKRGAKPKPSALRVVDGTHRSTRHGDEGEAKSHVAASIDAFGEMQCPEYLSGDALQAWEKFIAPAGWLDGSRFPAAVAFCELWDEFRAKPTHFPAAKHGQMRAYMAELGLTDERNRKEIEENEEDEFFA